MNQYCYQSVVECQESDETSTLDSLDIYNILPLWKLALHAEGAPLILPTVHKSRQSSKFGSYDKLSGKDVIKSNINANNAKQSSESLFKGNDLFLSQRVNRRSFAANASSGKSSVNASKAIVSVALKRDELHYNSDDISICSSESLSLSVEELHKNNTLNGNKCAIKAKTPLKPNYSDCFSITSEDSSSASDHCLPRVIKPRKRRKKTNKLVNSCSDLCVKSGVSCGPICVNTPSSSPVIAIVNNNPKLESVANKFKSDQKMTASRPPQRPWIPLGHPDRTRLTSIFTVMCYNVLCDKLATRQLYGYCPNWALAWDYRRKAILDEIRHYSADIISLQEVETDQFYNYFLPELQRDGYDGIFSPKSRAKTMSENERRHVDGCAIFYRNNKFSLIKEHLVEFNQLAMANAEGSDDMLNRVMTKDNIGLAALLQTKEGAFEAGLLPDPSQAQHPLLVCTAHIHWDPEFCDVKLIQTIMLMHELKSFVEDSAQSFRPGAQKADANSVPLILCGDLNSLPDSGVVDFLSSGRISADHPDFKELGYKDCLRKISCSEKASEYTHPFKIAKAYGDDIMPFTNYTFDFKGVIDYIFYSKNQLSVLGLLGPLDPEWLRENKVAGCPHQHIPSDHFPLLVELEMTPNVGTHLSNGHLLRR